MLINCSCCGAACEVDFEPAVGQHIICPFCNAKFSYGVSQDAAAQTIMAVCPYCGNRKSVSEDAIGKVGACSKCHKKYTILANARGIPLKLPKKQVPSLTEMVAEEKRWTSGRLLRLSLLVIPILLLIVWAAFGFVSPDYLLLLADQRWVSRQLGNRYLLCSCHAYGDFIEMEVSPIRSDIFPSPKLVDKLRRCKCGQDIWPNVFGEDIAMRLNKQTGEVKVLKGSRPFGWDETFMRELIRRSWRSYGYHSLPHSGLKMADEPHLINPVFVRAE